MYINVNKHIYILIYIRTHQVAADWLRVRPGSHIQRLDVRRDPCLLEADEGGDGESGADDDDDGSGGESDWSAASGGSESGGAGGGAALAGDGAGRAFAEGGSAVAGFVRPHHRVLGPLLRY